MIDFTALMGKAQNQGWALVALDLAVDTTTPVGEATANMLATFAQFERRLISQRTKEGLRSSARAVCGSGVRRRYRSASFGASSASESLETRCGRSPTT